MVRDEEMIRELIAEKERIDKLINSYQERNGELSAMVPVTNVNQREYSFDELLEQSLVDDELCTTAEIVRGDYNINIVRFDPTITISVDKSSHTTTNKESHVNTTLAGGDKVIDALGGLLHKLFN